MDESEKPMWGRANLRSGAVKPQVAAGVSKPDEVGFALDALWTALWITGPLWKVREQMKSFYTAIPEVSPPPSLSADDSLSYTHTLSTRARIAVYDGAAVAPRVEELWSESVSSYIERLSARVYELVKEQGGTAPYTIIREIVENFVHAGFAEPVVSVLDRGKTLRFADQGPGISDKTHAVLPGYTTAHGEMKRYIRGVGSGLPIVRDYLSVSGGNLVIEDNLGCGAVITIYTAPAEKPSTPATSFSGSPSLTPAPPTGEPAYNITLDLTGPDETVELPVAKPRLSTRQKQVIALVMESGSAGPSLVSKELGVGISTAYRDLASLEELGLITSDGGKRHLTIEGLSYLDTLTSGY